MAKELKEYTMEELWGKGVADEIALTIAPKEIETTTTETKTSNRLKYCIKLKHGGYVCACGEHDIIELPVKDYADTFDTTDEAQKFCREYWLDAEIVPWNARKCEISDEY